MVFATLMGANWAMMLLEKYYSDKKKYGSEHEWSFKICFKNFKISQKKTSKSFKLKKTSKIAKYIVSMYIV